MGKDIEAHHSLRFVLPDKIFPDNSTTFAGRRPCDEERDERDQAGVDGSECEKMGRTQLEKRQRLTLGVVICREERALALTIADGERAMFASGIQVDRAAGSIFNSIYK